MDAIPKRISIYRTDRSAASFAEKSSRIAEEVLFSLEGAIASADAAVRADELTPDVVAELRDIHSLVRQRALGASPQGRLI